MRQQNTRWVGVIAVLALGVAMLGGPPASGSVTTGRRPSGTITVSAAASLTEAFTQIKERFERRYRGATVTYNFGSSSALVNQIQGGAPVDAFASADLTNMDKLVAGGQVTASPTTFARNQMAIAVKPGNPQRVQSVADLARVGTVSLCGATVPCGVYAAGVLRKAGVSLPESHVTRGADAKATLAAVAQGDADAAIVYVTDVEAAGATVEGVSIPDDQNVVAVYPIAPIAGAGNPKLAKAFVEFVASPAGSRVLAKYGFLAP